MASARVSWQAIAAAVMPWRGAAPRLSRRELAERVIDLERQVAGIRDQGALRMAGVERRANLLSAFHRDRLEALERQIRELNPALPPVDRTGGA